MKKFLYLNSKMMAIMLALVFSVSFWSCSDDDDDDNSGDLNKYEKVLVGQWISIDDDMEILEMQLKSNRAGKFKVIYDGKLESESNIKHWEATQNRLTTIDYEGDLESFYYRIDGNKMQCGDVLYKKK